MGIFSKLAITLKTNKKSDMYLPVTEDPISISEDSIKCTAKPYKTIASFDLNIEKPKYAGALPDATIKFYPLD